eukprot:gene14575-19574_t
MNDLKQQKQFSSKVDEIYQSWNLHSKYSFLSKNNTTHMHYNEAIDIIYAHQHPPDCSKVKFMISLGYKSGFGSELHVEGMVLAIAMQMNRIFIPTQPRDARLQWQTPSSICGGDKTLSCYLEPWTNCTWNDVVQSITKQPKRERNYDIGIRTNIAGRIVPELKVNDGHYAEFLKTSKIPSSLIKFYEEEEVITLFPSVHTETPLTKIIPHQLFNILKTIPIDYDKRFYWWRAMSAAYLIRPNNFTSSTIKEKGIAGINPLNGQCVSMYVRHGDKGREMKLLPFEEYGKAAMEVWKLSFDSTHDYNNKYDKNHKNLLKYNRTIVLGTETPQVLADAIQWGERNGWNILYNPLQLDIFRHKGLSMPIAKSSQSQSSSQINNMNSNHTSRLLNTNRQNQMPRSRPSQSRFSDSKHDLEYMSMLINLADFMKCDAYVCTLRSNFCRLLDELRASVAGKSTSLFADLSYETCSQPPCIGNNIVNFDWRRKRK